MPKIAYEPEENANGNSSHDKPVTDGWSLLIGYTLGILLGGALIISAFQGISNSFDDDSDTSQTTS